MSLRAALATIHRDPHWWRKILIGGALSCTLLGQPFAQGMTMESLDNTRKGYPTPLPLWHDWSTRYVIGLFAVLIDFLFYVLPFFVAGLLFFCVALTAVISRDEGIVRIFTTICLSALGLFELAMFLIGVSPVGRLVYVDEGSPEKAMSGKTLREALRPGARAVYARARLQSLPAYLPVLVLLGVFWTALQSSFPFVWLILLVLYWLLMSALLYAHLVVLQIYAGAEQELRERNLERPIG